MLWKRGVDSQHVFVLEVDITLFLYWVFYNGYTFMHFLFNFQKFKRNERTT